MQRDVLTAYGTQAQELAEMLGTVVSANDPDRIIVEQWARSLSGKILDVGSGTGRWSGYLHDIGHDIEGLEPVEEFVTIARQAHPAVNFRLGSIADLKGSDAQWAGILAWYSLIHLSPSDFSEALVTLYGHLEEGGTILLSFFSGNWFEPFNHPVATAYRWPIEQMITELARTGFTVEAKFVHPGSPHAALIATASRKRQI